MNRIQLSDTQAVILSAACAHDDGLVFPITITRGVTESTAIEIDVETRKLAATAAFEKLLQTDDARWTFDEGSWNNGDATIARVDLLPES